MLLEMGKNRDIKVAVDFVGCKLNQAEIEHLARQLAGAGYTVVSPEERADIYILNTCTVTHIADGKCRRRLRTFRRANPDAGIIATGCYAQRAPEELARIEGVSLVAGNEEKPNLVPVLTESGLINPREGKERDNAVFRTRALIKVQDGCTNFCAYCIVPFVRVGEMSLPADSILTEVKKREAEGYQEVILTGTEIGSYHHNGIDLKGLIELILAETEIPRIRLSSLQPPAISLKLVTLWRNGRLCRHLHLPLQSGSDSVLKRMNRRYTTAEYQQAVSLIRESVPDAAITTDVIVGFPGETGEEFEESYQFCRQVKFARSHIFPYSPRQGTQAASMPDQISPKIKKQRSEQMLALAKESAVNFRKQFIGKTTTVLWEQATRGIWSGLTDNYIKVYVKSKKDLANQLLTVKLVEIYKDGVWGSDPLTPPCSPPAPVLRPLSCARRASENVPRRRLPAQSYAGSLKRRGS